MSLTTPLALPIVLLHLAVLRKSWQGINWPLRSRFSDRKPQKERDQRGISGHKTVNEPLWRQLNHFFGQMSVFLPNFDQWEDGSTGLALQDVS
ncbi:hypothetical protein [Leptolyngbya sp. KIOST-1]|uniref:hypothetical protein n=1 Tax=Leptolyngbya sp. KIOST-1 TaxID=1229172 RepID=UPI0012DFFD54|nr:hypothetical protein [Leptolyngbya sp. KIOST-1]